MNTLLHSLSWALMQSCVQGLFVYVALSVLLWTIPVSKARMRHGLSLLSLCSLLLGFFVSWSREFNSLVAVATAPLITISPQSFSWATGGTSVASLVDFCYSPYLGDAYIVGVVLMLLRLLLGIGQVVSLRNIGTKQAVGVYDALFVDLKRRMGISRSVRLLVSARARVPMVVGVLKPVVLVPAATVMQLSPGQLEAILLHELAHVKRYDYLANIVQAAVETVLFFNPFVWLVSAGVRDERERCCDDMVVSMVDEPLDYATALTALASIRPVSGTFTVAATGKSGRLFVRVQRIMEHSDLRLSYSKVVASSILLVALLVSLAWIKPTFNHKARKSTAGVPSLVSEVASPEAEKSAVDMNLGTSQTAGADKAKANQKVSSKAKSQNNGNSEDAGMTEENLLVNRLLQDRLVDQVRGFLVERHFKDLYINRQVLPADISSKYLQGLKKDIIRVQVFPMEERMRMHPDADFIQVLLPFTFESPCVEKPTSKEGC
ncbi:MAG: M56 family metallopeptidase [Taibaiella sp.]|nr:M56 family metallopeptidase [Taibaiella sp.]